MIGRAHRVVSLRQLADMVGLSDGNPVRAWVEEGGEYVHILVDGVVRDDGVYLPTTPGQWVEVT